MSGCEDDGLHVAVVGSGGGGDRLLTRMVMGKGGQYQFVEKKSRADIPPCYILGGATGGP